MLEHWSDPVSLFLGQGPAPSVHLQSATGGLRAPASPPVVVARGGPSMIAWACSPPHTMHLPAVQTSWKKWSRSSLDTLPTPAPQSAWNKASDICSAMLRVEAQSTHQWPPAFACLRLPLAVVSSSPAIRTQQVHGCRAHQCMLLVTPTFWMSNLLSRTSISDTCLVDHQQGTTSMDAVCKCGGRQTTYPKPPRTPSAGNQPGRQAGRKAVSSARTPWSAEHMQLQCSSP
jgi:hypothetical protein